MAWLGTVTFDAARRSTPPRKHHATASRQGHLSGGLRVWALPRFVVKDGRIDTTQPKASLDNWHVKAGNQGDLAMATIEETPRKCILKAGSTTLTLDKESGKATLQQKMLLWNKKPVEFALSDIDDIAVKSDVDGLSGAAIHHSVLHRRTGEITVLTTEEAKDAAETVKKLRGFAGL
jgi:hypothetical protein